MIPIAAEPGTETTGSPAGVQARARREPAERHVPVLDGIRGVAILLVLTIHFTLISRETLFGGVISRIAGLGWSGVDLFFVLSGYLITGKLLESRESPYYFRGFYARRILRIFPLYYVFLAFAFWVAPIVAPGLGEPPASGLRPFYWLYWQNFLVAVEGASPPALLGVTWSLAIEEQFYLAWPLVVRLTPPRRLPQLLAGLFGGELVLRAAALAFGVSTSFLYFRTQYRLDGLVLGALIAVLLREPATADVCRKAARFLLPASAVALAVITAVEGGFAGRRPLVSVAGFSALALFFGSLLAILVTSPERSPHVRLFSGRILRSFGKYSYGIYILHIPVLLWLQKRFPMPELAAAHGDLPAQLIYWVVGFGGSFLLALISWHLMEKWFLRLKRVLPSRA